jgi:glutamate dehydrogenase/leucine dehydrogenase
VREATAKGVKAAFEAMKKEAGNEFMGQLAVIKGDDRY